MSPLAILADRGLWRRTVLGFVAAALVPYVLFHLGDQRAYFPLAASGFALYFAVAWFLVLRALVRPQPVPWQQLAGVVALTLSVGIGLTLWVEGPFTWDDAGPIAWILGVGLPEEGAKLLGVFVVVHVVKARYTPRTFLFLGAVSGLAFGAAEAAGYAINGGAFTSSESELVVTAVWRLLTGSLFHACMAGITAFFLGLAQERARHARALVVTGLLVAGVLHGVYDDVADDYVGVLVAAAVVLTFIAYAERGEQVLERLAGAPLVAPSPLPADVQ